MSKQPDTMRCSRCHENRAEGEWLPSAWKRQRGGYCRSCQAAYYKDRVSADKGYFLKYQNARRKVGYDKIKALKESLGCMVCGYNKCHAALDFHHRDQSTKKHNICRVWNLSWERAMEEIAKCDLLCANCHREHHFNERESARQAIASVTAPSQE